MSVSEPAANLPNPNLPPAFQIPPSPPTLLSALRSLYLHISRNPTDKGTVSPRVFIDKIKELNELFRGSMHQDAHEFLNFLLNRIMEEMEDDRRRLGSAPNGVARSGEDLSNSIATLSTVPVPSTSTAIGTSYHSTIVHRLFEGVLTSETRCLTCETVSSRDESFIDLSIDIEQNSSVTACLRQFSASEMLCQKNKFFCDSCCDLQEAEKRMKIKKLPNVLALHLKRFKYQEDVGKYIKLAYRVAFPLELRLFNTVDDAEDPDRLYELFAIVVHIGTGPHHGHYVTIIKARGAWLLFDDDTVSTIKESDIPKYFGDSNSGSAYVLYYQAVDLDLTALGIKPPMPPPASLTSTDIGSARNQPLSLATAAEADEGAHVHVPGSPSPAIPPGLTEEPDSDKSDSPMLGTPASHPVPLSPSHAHTPKLPCPPAPPNLVLSIPTSSVQSPPLPIPSSPSHTQHSHTLGGLFHSLRQSPSLRLRANGDHRKSAHEPAPPVPSLPYSPSASQSSSGRRPRTAQSSASTAETSLHTHEGGGAGSASASASAPSVPPSPSPSKSYAFPNGGATPTQEKARAPERKRSAWGKWKSARQDAETPSSPITTSASLALSATSTVGSGVDEPASPTHKKSSPELSRSLKREKRSSSKLPPRPSTAGGRMGSGEYANGNGNGNGAGSGSGSGSRPTSTVTPPVPPLPASPTAPDRNANTNGMHAKGKDRENGNAVSPQMPASAGEHAQPHLQSRAPLPSSQSAPPGPHLHKEFHPFAAHAGLGFSTSAGSVGDTPVVPPSSSSGSSAGGGSGAAANWKRATRKLSLTAPMLGLGRRDREKTKEREREKTLAR
ncbi:hypothetical protein BC628DRAFT_1200738 [Trametes gibbosa]|nr:hypothetical protein BC628DRAFT_1200738 [Trametes gibbosa]